MKKLIRLGAIFIAALMVLAGCSTGKEMEKKKEEKTLAYATAKDIGDMNPHVYGGSMSAEAMLYEPLVKNTEKGIKPLLAKSWEVSEDGKTYTFKLRGDVKFHDGEKFNAEAVKKNFDAVQANKQLHSWMKLSTLITGTKVKDEYTVEVSLSEPYHPALAELALPRPYVFVSPKAFKDGTTKDGVKSFVGTGPFKMGEHKKDEQATFEKNDNYWGNKSKLEKVVAKVMPAGETSFLALQKGEVNFAFTDDRGADSIDKDSLKQLTDSKAYQALRSKPMNTKMVVANSGRKDSPISEKEVRKALLQAIDQETISKKILDGVEKPAHQLFAKNVTDINFELDTAKYDLEKAKAMLDKAGWKAKDNDSPRKKDGRTLSLEVYYDNASNVQKEEAEFLQAEYKKIGVELKLNGETSDKIAERRTSGKYDLLFNQTWGLQYDPQSTVSAFKAKNGYEAATAGMDNKKAFYDNIDEVLKMDDKQARQAKYKEIMEQVHDEAIFMPLTYGGMTVVAPSDLTGMHFLQSQYELPFSEMDYK